MTYQEALFKLRRDGAEMAETRPDGCLTAYRRSRIFPDRWARTSVIMTGDDYRITPMWELCPAEFNAEAFAKPIMEMM